LPGKPPYFQFYPNDFAADGVVEAMTTEQVGAYTLLLCKAWLQEPPGTIPNDDTILARWTRLSPERWSEIRPGVVAAFGSGDDGRLHQKRMKHEFAKLVTTARKKSRGGKRGAQKRWAEKDDRIPNGLPSGTPNNTNEVPSHGIPTVRTYDSDSSSESDSGFSAVEVGVGGGGGGGSPPINFVDFWKAYPRKVAKPEAVKAWQKIAPDAALAAATLAGVERHKKSKQWLRDEGEYIPHPSTFLNQRRWDDEVRTTEETKFSGLKEFAAGGDENGH
jgi:uncharacterized protein YdaU (DUF1376 family)